MQQPSGHHEATIQLFRMAADKDRRALITLGTCCPPDILLRETQKPLQIRAAASWVFHDLKSNAVLMDIDGKQEQVVNIRTKELFRKYMRSFIITWTPKV